MSKKTNNVIPALILFFGLLVFISMFFDVLKDSNGVTMTGITATFGRESFQFGGFTRKVNFSFMNALAFILPGLLSVVFMAVASSYKKGSSANLFFGVILTAAFTLSVVLLFQLPVNTTHSYTLGGSTLTQNYSNQNLAIGAILGYSFGIAGAFVSLLYTITQFRK